MSGPQIFGLYVCGVFLGVFLSSLMADDDEERGVYYAVAFLWPVFAPICALALVMAVAFSPLLAVAWLGGRIRRATDGSKP